MSQDSVPTPALRSRRRWWLAVGIAAGTGVLLALAVPFAIQPLVVGAARSELDRRLEGISESIGRPIKAGELSATFTEEIVLKDLSIASRDGTGTILSLGKVRLGFSLWDAIMGRRMPDRVVIVSCLKSGENL